MTNSDLPPVFDSKNVLISHIRGKLIQLIPLSCAVDDLAIEICDDRNNHDIIKLLVDDNLLRDAALNLKVDGRTKQRLGGELFYSVSKVETSLCAQITGMLLELDIFTICELLCDPDALESAVLKAKEEYMKFKQKSSKDLIGEELYSRVLEHYPNSELAAQLTGMLLEMDLPALQRLLEDPAEFNRRLTVAYEATNTEVCESKENLPIKITAITFIYRTTSVVSMFMTKLL